MYGRSLGLFHTSPNDLDTASNCLLRPTWTDEMWNSLNGIANMLLEPDPRLVGINRIQEAVDPVGVGGGREVEDGANLI